MVFADGDAAARPMRPGPRSARRSRAPSCPWPTPPPTRPGPPPPRPGVRLEAVVHAAVEAARAALARTPDQLALLRDAGVVDAGGRGLCVVLDAAESAITGRTPVPPAVRSGGPRRSRSPSSTGPRRRPERPDGRRPGVRGDVPARRRRHRDRGPARGAGPARATRWSWSAARDCGTSTCTSTTSVLRWRPGSRPAAPRRIRVTHFAEQVTRARETPGAAAPRRLARWSPSRRARAGPAVHRGRGAGRRGRSRTPALDRAGAGGDPSPAAPRR